MHVDFRQTQPFHFMRSCVFALHMFYKTNARCFSPFTLRKKKEEEKKNREEKLSRAKKKKKMFSFSLIERVLQNPLVSG